METAAPPLTETRGWQRRFLAPFSRIQAAGSFIPAIDGLRFYAFMSVIAVHWAQQVRDLHYRDTQSWMDVKFFENGAFGVQLFYVISGFILALPFARAFRAKQRSPSLKKYYLRRLTRLEPPYILNLIVFLIVYVTVLHPGSFRSVLPEFAACLTYTHGLFFGGHCAPNTVTWTLEIEVQFYLLAPFIARVFCLDSALARRGLLAVAAVAIPWAIKTLHWQNQTYLFLPGSIQYFLAGFILADVYLIDWQEAPASSAAFDVLAAGAALPLIFNLKWAKNDYELVLPFLILCFYIGVFRGRLFRRFTENIWIVTTGGMCYTIYLYHLLPVWLLAPLGRHIGVASWPDWANVLLQLLIVSPAIIAFCAVLFVLFERPFMKREWYKGLFSSKLRRSVDT